ncbi:MAG: hypothetical protein ACTSQE_14490 [Candidatus Heimdallarchaeaceae archaeon]
MNNTKQQTENTISAETKNSIGEIHPFFQFNKELDPFMYKEGEHTLECPFYYLIDVDEKGQLYFIVQEAKPGEKTKILFIETINSEFQAKKILNEKKHPLFKILQSALRQGQHKIVGSIESVSYDMIAKLYQALASIFIDGELEFFLEQRKQELKHQNYTKLQTAINQEILEEIKANPVAAINKACEAVGIIKETKNKIALYLSGILGNSAGLIYITGNTSTGKSHLMSNVLKLYPDNFVYELSSFSEKALLYLCDENKEEMKEAELWCIHETTRMSSEFRDVVLRLATNPDDREFKYITVTKDKSGRNVSRVMTLPKISCWTTMTLGEINPENINRGILVSVEETQVKTESILEYEALYDAIGGKPDNSEYLETFKAWSQELIEERRKITDWICPYFHPKILHLPTTNPSIVRHWKKIKRYAFGFAIINDRPIIQVEKKNLIIIEPADILLALELFKEILIETISEVDKRYRELYEVVARDIKESETDHTTIKRLHRRIKNKSYATIRLYLKILCKKNYLTYEKDPEDKKTNIYHLTSQTIDSVIDLDLSRIEKIWEINLTDLSQDKFAAIEKNYPKYLEGKIFLEHLKELYFLEKKLVDTEHPEQYRMFGMKMENTQATLIETAKQNIPNTRTQNEYIKNNSTESAIDPEDYQKVWNVCLLLCAEELENFTINQVYEKLQKQQEEIDNHTIELVLKKLSGEGYLIKKDEGNYALSTKRQQTTEKELVIQLVLEACKDLEQIHKGPFNRRDLTKYLKIKDKKFSEDSVDEIVSKLLQDGILFQPTASKLKLVRSG